MPGHSLSMLRQIMSNIYIPMVDPSVSEAGPGAPLTESIHIRSELTSNLNKFISQIQHTVQQVGGEILLQIPNVRCISHRNH